MPAPSVGFTTVASTDLDPDSPITTGLMTALYNNGVHLREWLGKNYTAAVDHDHDGVNSKIVQTAVGPNMLLHSTPDNGTNRYWTLSGFSLTNNKWFAGSSSGSYGYQAIPAQNPSENNRYAEKSRLFWGANGSPVVGSLYIKTATGGYTAGQLDFGGSDGSASTFLTGGKASIAYSDLSTSWKRFWFTATLFAGVANHARFLFRVPTTFSGNVHLSGFSLQQGTRLTPFYWSPLEGDDDHAEYNFTPWDDGPPVWNWTVSMDNAVKLTPV